MQELFIRRLRALVRMELESALVMLEDLEIQRDMHTGQVVEAVMRNDDYLVSLRLTCLDGRAATPPRVAPGAQPETSPQPVTQPEDTSCDL